MKIIIKDTETANENEFAEFETSLSETEEYAEVISERNAHMSKWEGNQEWKN